MYLKSFFALVFLAETQLFASGSEGESAVANILLSLAVIFIAAKLGAFFAVSTGQPAVLGELIAGLVLGNFFLLNINYPWFLELTSYLSTLQNSETLAIFAGIGVVLLLFEVGLESSLADLMKVGMSSTLVAISGVVAPFVLGFGASYLLLSDSSIYVHMFIGATLCATSVGITARTLSDIGQIKSAEAKIILGAAVIDDILGLVVLAVIAGLVGAVGAGQNFEIMSIVWIAVKAFSFLLVALLIGGKLSTFWMKLAAKLKVRGALITAALAFCFILSYVSTVLGLASIVGAFAAGLVLDSVKFEKDFASFDNAKMEESVLPVSRFFVPVFFCAHGDESGSDLFRRL